MDNLLSLAIEKTAPILMLGALSVLLYAIVYFTRQEKKILHYLRIFAAFTALVCGFILLPYCIDLLHGDLVTVNGVVSNAGRSGSRHFKTHYIEIKTSNDILRLYISDNSLSEYTYEDGVSYTFTYYPVSQTLCSIEPLNK